MFMDDNWGYPQFELESPMAFCPRTCRFFASQRKGRHSDFFQCQSSEVRLIFADVHKIQGA